MFKLQAPNSQRGINIVDFMMWLVIAALILAAAIQGINYYQKAAHTHNAKSDVAGEHAWANAKNSQEGKAPSPDQVSEALSNGDLKLTKGNTAIYAKYGEKYCFGVKSANLEGNNVFYASSDAPSTILSGTEIPASCGTITDFSAAAVADPTATPTPTPTTPTATPTPTPTVDPAPTDQPVVTGTLVNSTTVKFTWTPITRATSYLIEKQVNGGTWTAVPEGTTPTETVITGNGGDSIAVRVTPVNSGGSGPVSSTSTAVALPPTYTMAIWGNNNNYTFGSSTIATTFVSTTPMAFPNSVLSGKTVTDITSGPNHACAVADGAAYCWGTNGYGQLGTGNMNNQYNPIAVDATGALKGKTVTKIDGGDGNTCAIADGAPYCWGNTTWKMLGKNWSVGTSPVAADMTGVLAGKTFTDISVGDYSVCGIASGAAYCWGKNDYGQLGNNTITDSYTAVAVTGLAGKTVTSISTSRQAACAVADGAVYCWGRNNYGQLGNGTAINTTNKSMVPVLVSGLMAGKVAKSVDLGWLHTCALADGKVYCWGSNVNGGGVINGQLGNNNGTMTTTTIPVAVDASGVLAGKTVDKLFSGPLNSCALSGGKAYCWGVGSNGNIGDGNRSAAVLSPVAVVTSGILNGAVLQKLSLSVYHTLSL